jgi:hypothetical protein
MLRSMKAKTPYTVSLLVQLESDIVSPSETNPMGHILVPPGELTEVRLVDAQMLTDHN